MCWLRQGLEQSTAYYRKPGPTKEGDAQKGGNNIIEEMFSVEIVWTLNVSRLFLYVYNLKPTQL